jgi:hypothetical protein
MIETPVRRTEAEKMLAAVSLHCCAAERQRVEEDPRGAEAHYQGRHDDPDDPDHHRPPEHASEQEADRAHREAHLGEHPEKSPMTAKAVQATKAPTPCAVIIA